MWKILIAFAVVPRLVFAALPLGVNWEVRTTGSDTNGGGFVSGASGTDFSQQDAAQQAYTDLVIGGTTTQLTSVLHPFGATAPGNIINVTGGAGCTTGRYQVVSVVGITATMDRSVGTGASTCTGNLGGGLATIATAITSMVAGNTVWVKSGTYTQTTAHTIALSTHWEGYQTTHGDFGTAPLITTATNSTILLTVSNGGAGTSTWLALWNLNFSNTAAVRAAGLTASTNVNNSVTINGATFDGFTTAINTSNDVGSLTLTGAEVKNSTGAGITLDSAVAHFACSGCWIHNNTTAGLTGNSPSISFLNSIFSVNASGISVGAVSLSLVSCAFVSNTGSAIVAPTGGAGSSGYGVQVSNSIFFGNGAVALNFDNGANNVFAAINGRNNAYGSNTGGNFSAHVLFPGSPGDITLTANPFTSATNFALNNTAGGGALLRARGWPGTFPGGLTVSTMNVGPVQSSGASTAAAYIGEIRRPRPLDGEYNRIP